MDKNRFGIHVIATGNPVSGFELIGPFNNAEEAIEWADRVLDTHEWWAMPLVGQDSVEAPTTRSHDPSDSEVN